MNLYLAITHTLSLLEQPITPAAFAAAVQPANPLFASPCITPQGFLRWLSEEGLLQERRESFRLGPTGELLHQHVLNWTARDKAAIQQQTAARRAGGESPVVPDCPVCGTRFCAHYLFVVLLERLYAGLAVWNAWEEGEAALLAQALQAYHAEGPRYLLDQTEPLHVLSPARRENLERLLTTAEAEAGPELLADFYLKSRQRLLLPLLKLSPPYQPVSRLRFEQGLLEPEQLQALRRLAYPSLFTEPQNPGSQGYFMDHFKGHFIRLARPGLSPARERALLWLDDSGADRLLLLESAPLGWQLRKTFS
ncbi:MAG: hypothetical protein ACAI44_10690 [Candidatus Sericytochromatia bacterium]